MQHRARAACIKIHAYIVYKARPALHPIFSQPTRLPVAVACLLLHPRSSTKPLFLTSLHVAPGAHATLHQPHSASHRRPQCSRPKEPQQHSSLPAKFTTEDERECLEVTSPACIFSHISSSARGSIILINAARYLSSQACWL